MLVVTATNASMADRKPKVISGLRKTHVLRSPSLDGLPRLSGILNHFSESDEAWHLRWVVVRDGSLLVYSPEMDPRSQGCSTLSRLERGPNQDNYLPPKSNSLNDDVMMQSLDSGALRSELRLDANADTAREETTDIMDTPSSRKNLDQMLRRDQAIFDSAMTPRDTSSLGRNDGGGRGAGGGGACARLPLRHLNLRPSARRPLAFSLSRRVGEEDGHSCAVATFQAPSRRDYERWVKTLAVEILRQTPLDAVRFLDILGIAAFEDDKSKHEVRSNSADQVDFPDHTPIRPARMSRKAMFTNGDSKLETWKKPTTKTSPFDRTKSGSIKKHRNKNNGSFRKKDEKKNLLANSQEVARNLFDDKCRIPIMTCQSIVNCNNVTTVTISELKDTRGREVFTPEADIHADEGIVVEISDDDFSSGSDAKPRRLSEHSNCLDSPKSTTSHSSFGDSTTASTDCVDGFEDGIIRINIPHAVSIAKQRRDEINKRRSEADRLEVAQAPAPWAGCVLKPAGIDRLLAKDSVDQKIGKSPQIFTGRWSWENSAVYNQMSYPDRMFMMRARSCSPNKKASCAPRRYAVSCGRSSRFSTGQLSLTSDGSEEMVQQLKARCQSTDKYVPVRDKLALFETLSQMERRLARSSEDLLNKHSSDSVPVGEKRAQSLHDLTKSEVPSVPVKEMCKFFENISKDKLKSPSVLKKTKKSVNNNSNNYCPNEFNSFDALRLYKPTSLNVFKSNLVKIANNNKINSNDDFDRLNYVMCRQIKHGNKIISFV